MNDLYNDKDIIRYIKYKVNNQDWEDVLHDSIIEYLRIKNKDKIRNKKGYFFIIVKNQIYKYYKKKEIKNKHEVNTIIDNSYMEVDLLMGYNLLKDYYEGGLSISEMCIKYNVKKSTLYERIKNEKECLQNDLFL